MLELWAGVECTVNRVGDRYMDQLVRSGHHERTGDLAAFAALGISRIRYPVLWERTAPDGVAAARWAWPDTRLATLRELGVAPIIGLLHHGSGPPSTSLLDPDFPARLADYASAVARRYPWAALWTPINEPLTTARFSGLYGHWYPHARDDASFVRMLVQQARGTILAMQAIRAEQPTAQLVQTEDFGVTYSTPTLAYQARFENARRFLWLDLIYGRMLPSHPLWRYLRRHGITEAELAWFQEHATPPDLLGVDYYLMSDRYLDQRRARYPGWTHGGNRRHRYADVPAVLGWRHGITGHAAILEALWERYQTPVAITEAHAGGHRDAQLRWFWEAWTGATAAAARGVDVRAVTAWSLLGAFDWDRLVVEERGFYEPGVFDVRGPVPRPTALAALLRAIAAGAPFEHPALHEPGWWRLPARYGHSSALRGRAEVVDEPTTALRGTPPPAPRHAQRPILVVGSGGTLGSAFGRLCRERGLRHEVLPRRRLDVTDPAAVAGALATHRPWAVVNAAGYVRVDDAEQERERCREINTCGAEVLAEACATAGIRLLTFSTDLVFDGQSSRPYLESDPVAPLSVYGRTKAEAERAVLGRLPSALVVRTSAFFGPWDRANFVTQALTLLRERHPVRTSPAVVSPTYVPDLVHVALDLLIDGESGVWHLANRGALSWGELARRAATLTRLDPSLVEECDPAVLGHVAPRPAYSALGSERGELLPTLDEALDRYLAERRSA